MNVEQFHEFCLALPYVTDGFPFGGDVLVLKVKNKMFALTGVDTFEYINLKYPADDIEELRAKYDAIKPGYHMSKTHWNSVYLHQGLKPSFVKQLIITSYILIVNSLPKKDRFDTSELASTYNV